MSGPEIAAGVTAGSQLAKLLFDIYNMMKKADVDVKVLVECGDYACRSGNVLVKVMNKSSDVPAHDIETRLGITAITMDIHNNDGVKIQTKYLDDYLVDTKSTYYAIDGEILPWVKGNERIYSPITIKPGLSEKFLVLEFVRSDVDHIITIPVRDGIKLRLGDYDKYVFDITISGPNIKEPNNIKLYITKEKINSICDLKYWVRRCKSNIENKEGCNLIVGKMEDEVEGRLVEELRRDWNDSYLERFWRIRTRIIEEHAYGDEKLLKELLEEFADLWSDVEKEHKDLAPVLFGNIFEGLYTYSNLLISSPDQELKVNALKSLATKLLSLGPLTAEHETDFVVQRFNKYSNDLRNRIINEDLKVLTNMVVSKSHYDLCDLGEVFREQINEWFLSAVLYPGCKWLRTCDDFSGDDAIKCSVTNDALRGDSDSLNKLVMYLLGEVERNVNNPNKQELLNKFKESVFDLIEYFSQLPTRITSVEDLRKYGIPDMDLYTDRSLSISIMFRGIHKNEILLRILAYIMAVRTLRARLAFILNYFNKLNYFNYGCSFPKPIEIHEHLVKLLYPKSISDWFSAIHDVCEAKHDKEEAKDKVRIEIDNYERIKLFLKLYFYSLT
jgi:hypothetical protein